MKRITLAEARRMADAYRKKIDDAYKRSAEREAREEAFWREDD